MSGLGAATADTFYATLAFFSLALIEPFLKDNATVITVIGSILVILIGVNIFFKNPIVQIRRNRTGKSSLFQDYISIFLLTIANPGCFAIFMALFSAFDLSSEMGEVNGVGMLVGVLSGSVAFWFGLTFLVNLARKKFRPRHFLWMNRISGAIIVLIGLYAIITAFVPQISLSNMFLQ